MGRIVNADEIRSAVIDGILVSLAELQAPDFSPEKVADRFFRNSVFHEGSAVRWSEKQGTVSGLGPSGELIARDEVTGLLVSLYAEDVSLRF